MNYNLFGKSGLRVSEFVLGTMTFGTEWLGRDEANRVELGLPYGFYAKEIVRAIMYGRIGDKIFA